MSERHAPPVTGAAPSTAAKGASAPLPPSFYAPEPHQKYAIPESRRKPDMDYLWLPTQVFGMPNDRSIMEHYRMGWVPATAEEFPDISGYGTKYPQQLIDRGLVRNVEAGDVLDVDGLILMERPLELSIQGRKHAEREAADRVNNQMRRLQAAYRMNFDGGGVKRTVRPPLPDDGFHQQEA